MRAYRAFLMLMLTLATAACAGVGNPPINQPTSDPNAGLAAPGLASEASEDSLLVGLAFSGGGTRAAAFSFGVLKQLADTQLTLRGRRVSLLDHIDFVSGVSGGSITAAYFGLKKRAALDDFRERFLIKNAEENLRASVTLETVTRAVGGGANEDKRFRDWLDANLFEGATFSSLLAERGPRIWINATDIYNRTPFVFGQPAFSLICSDLANYPIAAAVAASAAVPLLFAPVVIETFPDRCAAKMPDWLARAQKNPDAPPLLRAFALGAGRYRDGSVKYIKLLDGGLADNFGLSGFTIARESSQTPYGPLSPAQAVKLRRMLFLVADAGRAPQANNWVSSIAGPSGADLILAATDSALDSSVRASFAAFASNTQNWVNDLVRWRCSLPAEQVRRLRGSSDGWNCRDLRSFIGRLAFDQLLPEQAARLEQVPTRLSLPPDMVDDLIAGGRAALTRHSAFRAFLGSL
jgi:NTE family protein